MYNTLNELVVMREVREVRAAYGPARYDPNVDAGHHHLVCRECGAIYDVLPSGLEGLRLARSQRHAFRGRCAACTSVS